MKAKLLLCMMALGMLGAMAQPPQPQIPEQLTAKVVNGNYFQMANPSPSMIKPTTTNSINYGKSKHITKAQINATMHQVDVNLDFDTEKQWIPRFTLVNEENIISSSEQKPELTKGSNLFQIPTGTYDIIAVFWQYVNSTDEDTPLYLRFVILEQVTIDHDMQIDIASSAAKNHIHCQTLNGDSEPVHGSKWYVDENWNFNEVEAGNIQDLLYHNYILCSDHSYHDNWDGNFGAVFEGAMQANGGEQLADFYVSDVSERYSLYSYRAFYKDNEIYTTAYEFQGASNDTTVYNDPSKFILFEEPFDNNSHHPDAERYLSLCFWVDHPDLFIWHLAELTSLIPLSPNQPIKTYIGTSPDDSEAGFIPILEVAASVETANWFFQPIEAISLYKSGDNIVVANTGTTFFATQTPATQTFRYEYSPENGDIGDEIVHHFAPNPIFSYLADDKIGNLGSSSPLLVTNMFQYFQQLGEDGIITDSYYEWRFLYDYIGQYGEYLVNDISEAQVNLKLNGEDLLSMQGSFVAQGAAPLEGVVDATIVNEGLLVDDLEGSNRAKVHYIAGAEDETPPTTTMLQFRSNNGNVTNRFAIASEGIMQFTAGDFNFFITPMTFWTPIRQAPESVEVSYSPYGEDNWDELPVEEVPENYWPVMGWFYTGSLASVTGQGLEGWFDLKIRLTDAAGNWQEQVLSPAFRIDDHAYSSVATITPSNKSDNAIYNLAGQRMRGVLESLPHGVYIVGGKKVVK